MDTIIKCKHCGKDIEVTEALKHQIEEQVLDLEREKHKVELAEAIKNAQDVESKKTKQKYEADIRLLTEAAAEEVERNKKFQEQLMDLNKELRKTRQEKEDARLEMEKKLAQEEEKIIYDTRKRMDEEHRLKDAEKEKKLMDALKVNEELRRKLEQGSQQSQGEVMELALEELLKREFPEDSIEEVKKGERGADIVQVVVDKLGRQCGRILWESKNAQWSEGWIKKLREDQRGAHAQLAILVVANPPQGVETFIYKEGVWICTFPMAYGLALALRFNLVHVHHERMSNVGKNEKMEVIYEYLKSVEFKQRIESIVEAFSTFQDEIEKEKRFFSVKWGRQEKELRKIIDNTYGMYGELQAVTGREISQIGNLEPEESVVTIVEEVDLKLKLD